MVTNQEIMEALAVGFNRFLYDDFRTLDGVAITKTGTAAETARVLDFKLSSGIMANSTIKVRYNYNIFNPTYADAYFRVQFSDTENIKAFFGFKETSDAPIFGDVGTMVEYHVGVTIEPDIKNALLGPKMYFSTGDGTSQQKVEILGIDATRDMIYKISGHELSTYPLPQVIPYFDNFRLITPDRVWTKKQDNSSVLPFDTTYYMMFYLKNLTNEEKNVRIKSVTYGEEYAD